MTLLIISIPLMILAVALAVIPLVVVSQREHRERRAHVAAPAAARRPQAMAELGREDSELPAAA
jgi:hypothetical protein